MARITPSEGSSSVATGAAVAASGAPGATGMATPGATPMDAAMPDALAMGVATPGATPMDAAMPDALAMGVATPGATSTGGAAWIVTVGDATRRAVSAEAA